MGIFLENSWNRQNKSIQNEVFSNIYTFSDINIIKCESH